MRAILKLALAAAIVASTYYAILRIAEHKADALAGGGTFVLDGRHATEWRGLRRAHEAAARAGERTQLAASLARAAGLGASLGGAPARGREKCHLRRRARPRVEDLRAGRRARGPGPPLPGPRHPRRGASHLRDDPPGRHARPRAPALRGRRGRGRRLREGDGVVPGARRAERRPAWRGRSGAGSSGRWPPPSTARPPPGRRRRRSGTLDVPTTRAATSDSARPPLPSLEGAATPDDTGRLGPPRRAAPRPEAARARRRGGGGADRRPPALRGHRGSHRPRRPVLAPRPPLAGARRRGAPGAG